MSSFRLWENNFFFATTAVTNAKGSRSKDAGKTDRVHDIARMRAHETTATTPLIALVLHQSISMNSLPT
jgi:hypothetical protein